MSKRFQAPPPWNRGNTELWGNEVNKYLAPGKMHDIAYLCATFSITADNNVFEDTGLSIVLPKIGFYIISITGHVHVDRSGGTGSLTFALYDTSIVANTELLAGAIVGTREVHAGSGFVLPYISTVDNQILKLYAKTFEESGGNWVLREITCDDTGRTSLGYYYYGKLKETL